MHSVVRSSSSNAFYQDNSPDNIGRIAHMARVFYVQHVSIIGVTK